MFAPQAELLLFNIQLKDLKFHHFWTFAFMRLNILAEVKMKVKQNLPELEKIKKSQSTPLQRGCGKYCQTNRKKHAYLSNPLDMVQPEPAEIWDTLILISPTMRTENRVSFE